MVSGIFGSSEGLILGNWLGGSMVDNVYLLYICHVVYIYIYNFWRNLFGSLL